jgi:hypothetical protein
MKMEKNIDTERVVVQKTFPYPSGRLPQVTFLLMPAVGWGISSLFEIIIDITSETRIYYGRTFHSQ